MRGTCVGGVCFCHPGATGYDCASQACAANCHGNGVCEHGVCICTAGFTGVSCAEADPVVPPLRTTRPAPTAIRVSSSEEERPSTVAARRIASRCSVRCNAGCAATSCPEGGSRKGCYAACVQQCVPECLETAEIATGEEGGLA